MTTPDLSIDRDAVSRWLTLIYTGTRGYVHIACSGNWVGRTFGLDELAEAERYITLLDRARPAGIYARVTTLSRQPGAGERGGDTMSASLPALWADIDIAGPGHNPPVGATLPPDEDAARRLVEHAQLPPPTVWVHSGGGLYPLWLLHPVRQIECAEDVIELRRLSAGWQEVIAHAAGRMGLHYGPVGDLSRVLKVPGTWNRKIPDDPRPCRILEPIGARYALADLERAMEQAMSLLPPAPAPTPRRPATVRPAGDVLPGADFAARVDWSDPLLLGGLDWTMTYRKASGERGWLRPGAHSELTATTGRDGLDNLWCFSDATYFPQGEVVSKFRALRYIHGYKSDTETAAALGRLGFGTPRDRAGRAVFDAPPYEPQWPPGTTGIRPEVMPPNGAERPIQPVYGDGRSTPAPGAKAPPRVDGEDVSSGDLEDDTDDDGTEDEVDTWLPIDLGPYLRGEILRAQPELGAPRTDGVRMLYPGKEHAVIGEMESGKTFFALFHCAAELLAERHVVYIHFEESDPTDTVDRLVSLGCSPHEVLTYFHFVGPSQPIGKKQRSGLTRLGASIVVLDGVNEGMALHKADIRDENGAAEFRRIMVKAFTRKGAAVLSLDHVVKDRESRDRYALGSIHKGNAVDGAIFVLETAEAFGRGQRGRSHVFATKDRPGYLRRHGRVTKLPGKTFMGEFVLDDTRAFAPRLTVAFYAPAKEEEGGDADPTGGIEGIDDGKALAAIGTLTGKALMATFTRIRAESHLQQRRCREALDRLVVAQRIIEISGPRGALIYMTPEEAKIRDGL
jgi:hypothetical protein